MKMQAIMGIRKILFSIGLALVASTASAQTFLDNLRKVEDGKGKVTVTQSATIDSLVNGTKPLYPDNSAATQKPATNVANGNANAGTAVGSAADKKPSAPAGSDATHRDAKAPAASTPSASSQHQDTEETVGAVDHSKKVMRNSYKTQGYRIQVFSGGNSRDDKQKAEAAGNKMKSSFPNQPVYVHFYSPSWKCRMGNYKTIEEARTILAQVKKLGFNQACIVKGTISVQY